MSTFVLRVGLSMTFRLLSKTWPRVPCRFMTKVDNRRTLSNMLPLLFSQTERCGDGGRTTRIWLSRHYRKKRTECKGVVICLWTNIKPWNRFRWVFCQLEVLRHCL